MGHTMYSPEVRRLVDDPGHLVRYPLDGAFLNLEGVAGMPSRDVNDDGEFHPVVGDVLLDTEQDPYDTASVRIADGDWDRLTGQELAHVLSLHWDERGTLPVLEGVGVTVVIAVVVSDAMDGSSVLEANRVSIQPREEEKGRTMTGMYSMPTLARARRRASMTLSDGPWRGTLAGGGAQ